MTPALNPTIKAMLASLGADRRFVRGAGTQLFDDAGREYLDCWAQYGVLALGHNPPAVVAAVRDALAAGRPPSCSPTAPPTPRRWPRSWCGARRPGSRAALFTNSGAETVEAAIKLARVATGGTRVLSTEGGYHGSTYAAMAASGQPDYRDGFGPLPAGFDTVPYGDADALDARLARDGARDRGVHRRADPGAARRARAAGRLSGAGAGGLHAARRRARRRRDPDRARADGDAVRLRAGSGRARRPAGRQGAGRRAVPARRVPGVGAAVERRLRAPPPVDLRQQQPRLPRRARHVARAGRAAARAARQGGRLHAALARSGRPPPERRPRGARARPARRDRAPPAPAGAARRSPRFSGGASTPRPWRRRSRSRGGAGAPAVGEANVLRFIPPLIIEAPEIDRAMARSAPCSRAPRVRLAAGRKLRRRQGAGCSLRGSNSRRRPDADPRLGAAIARPAAVQKQPGMTRITRRLPGQLRRVASAACFASASFTAAGSSRSACSRAPATSPSERRRSSTFIVPWDDAPERWRLFEERGGRRTLRLAGGMTARIADGAAVTSIDARAADAPARPIPLSDRARGKVTVGDTTVLFQLLRPPAPQPRPQLPLFDPPPRVRRDRSLLHDRPRVHACCCTSRSSSTCGRSTGRGGRRSRRSPTGSSARSCARPARRRRPRPPRPTIADAHAQAAPPAPRRRRPRSAPRTQRRQRDLSEVANIGLIPLLTARGPDGRSAIDDVLSGGAVDRSLDEALRNVGGLGIASNDSLNGVRSPGAGDGKVAHAGGSCGPARASKDVRDTGPVAERDVSSRLKVDRPVIEGGRADLESITREIRAPAQGDRRLLRARAQDEADAGRQAGRSLLDHRGRDDLGRRHRRRHAGRARGRRLRARDHPALAVRAARRGPVELSFPFVFQAGG